MRDTLFNTGPRGGLPNERIVDLERDVAKQRIRAEAAEASLKEALGVVKALMDVRLDVKLDDPFNGQDRAKSLLQKHDRSTIPSFRGPEGYSRFSVCDVCGRTRGEHSNAGYCPAVPLADSTREG
jgi:hypothetical protein